MTNLSTHAAPWWVFCACALLMTACSSDKKPAATTNTAAPAKPKQVDPYAAAMKAELEQKRKRNAQDSGERSGLQIVQRAESVAQSKVPAKTEEPVADNTAPSGTPAANPKFKSGGRGPNMRDSAPGGPSGTMKTSDLARTFRKYQNGLQNCYERGLKRAPSLRGKVKLVLTINTKGRVANVGIGQNTLGDAGVTNCMKSQAKRWVFPEPEGGKVTVAKTFIFAPQS